MPLPSGGNLVIDHAEALTVIDVNTGRFTRGKGLEDTITKTNLEAAREVVRQLRLRDIGGIIIIDFIDMAHAKNREMVLATLEAELETDRTKTYVVELSPLGLVEMTRQNTTDGARGILTRACPDLPGQGARPQRRDHGAQRRAPRPRAGAQSQAKAWLIEVNGAVAERLSGARLKRLEKQTGRRVFLEGGAGLPVDAFRVISRGHASRTCRSSASRCARARRSRSSSSSASPTALATRSATSTGTWSSSRAAASSSGSAARSGSRRRRARAPAPSRSSRSRN